MAITSAIGWTFKEKLYNELGLETLEKKDGTGNCFRIPMSKVLIQY